MITTTLVTLAGEPVEINQVFVGGPVQFVAGRPVQGTRYRANNNQMELMVDGVSYYFDARTYFQMLYDLDHIPAWAKRSSLGASEQL